MARAATFWDSELEAADISLECKRDLTVYIHLRKKYPEKEGIAHLEEEKEEWEEDNEVPLEVKDYHLYLVKVENPRSSQGCHFWIIGATERLLPAGTSSVGLVRYVIEHLLMSGNAVPEFGGQSEIQRAALQLDELLTLPEHEIAQRNDEFQKRIASIPESVRSLPDGPTITGLPRLYTSGSS